MTANPYENARIVGVHTTEQARRLEGRTSFSLGLEALNGALADAGMEWDDLDGFASHVVGGPSTPQAWADQVNRPWRWMGRSIHLDCLLDACAAVSSGRVNAIAFVMASVRPADGVAPWLDHDLQWTSWAGSLPDQPVQFGLVARRYLHEVGDRALDAMATVAASTRNFGSINPDAVYFGRGPFTASDVLDSRPVIDPYTLLMCSAVTDGGGAFIIAHKDRVPESGHRGVAVACGDAYTHYQAYDEPPHLDDYWEMTQRYRTTMQRSGVRPDDIDVVEFYDHFASHYLLQYESFGFCDRGEAADLILDGQTTLDGRWPTCTDGGNLSFSHSGFPVLFRVVEAVRQLRGEVKDLCPGHEQGIHTFDPSICRKVAEPHQALVSCPGTPTIMGSFAVLAGD